MATANLSTDELLRAIQRLGVGEIEQLLARIIQLKAERSAPSVSSSETDLLLQINRGLSEDEAHRYCELMDRRRAAMLTPSEHQDLLRLTETAEALQARRVRCLVELARLRGTSLSALAEELGIQPSPDA